MFIVPVAAIPKEGLKGWRRGVTRGCCIAVGLDRHRNRPRVEIAIRWMLYSSPADAVANMATVSAGRVALVRTRRRPRSQYPLCERVSSHRTAYRLFDPL